MRGRQAAGGAALSAQEETKGNVGAGESEPEDRPEGGADSRPDLPHRFGHANRLDRTGQSDHPGPTDPSVRRRRLFVLVSIAVVVWGLDQITKLLAVEHLDTGGVELLGGLLKLNLVYNSGAAFGLAQGYTPVLTILAAGVVGVVIFLARRLASLPWAWAFGLILGGAGGNLTDRIFRAPGPLQGHVVDFVELPHWPVFNLGDTAICGAAALVVVLSLTGRHLDGTRDQRPARPNRSTESTERAEPE